MTATPPATLTRNDGDDHSDRSRRSNSPPPSNHAEDNDGHSIQTHERSNHIFHPTASDDDPGIVAKEKEPRQDDNETTTDPPTRSTPALRSALRGLLPVVKGLQPASMTTSTAKTTTTTPTRPFSSLVSHKNNHDLRQHADQKVVGLKHYGISSRTKERRQNEWLLPASGSLGGGGAGFPTNNGPSLAMFQRRESSLSNEDDNDNRHKEPTPILPFISSSYWEASPPPPPKLIQIPPAAVMGSNSTTPTSPTDPGRGGINSHPTGIYDGNPTPTQTNIPVQDHPPPPSTSRNKTPPPPPPPLPRRFVSPPRRVPRQPRHNVKSSRRRSVEELEDIARRRAVMNPFELLLLGNAAALKVMGLYLITLETFITCALTAGLTVYWYHSHSTKSTWNGGGLDFVLLAFAVTSPISAAIGMAFQRRERALTAIADFRSFSYHLFLAHCLWDWPAEDNDDKHHKNNNNRNKPVTGRSQAQANQRVDWLEHCDAVLAQLIGIGDELSRFLTLPTASRGRHRMTHKGRKEAARTMEVAYYLLESMTTQRMTRLIHYSERLKWIGLPSGEISRVRQYERFLSDILEQLRMVKLYRTPQALRSFARIFTVLLPPFYAPSYAQVGRDVDSLGVGIAFGIITALGLTALFESLQVLEDPFTAFLALDGIDTREEFEVLHYAQMIQTRKLVFPNAPDYPAGRRAALTHWNQDYRSGSTMEKNNVGMPPTQAFHVMAAMADHPVAPSVRSGITMDNLPPPPPPLFAGDDTAVTAGTFVPPDIVVQEEQELGHTLPANQQGTDNRESVFGEDREESEDAVSEQQEQQQRNTGRRRSFSFFSLERAVSGPGGGRPASEHTHADISSGPQRLPPSPVVVATTTTTMRAPEDEQQSPAPSLSASARYHRRTHTSLSAAGMLSPNSSSTRFPDF